MWFSSASRHVSLVVRCEIVRGAKEAPGCVFWWRSFFPSGVLSMPKRWWCKQHCKPRRLMLHIWPYTELLRVYEGLYIPFRLLRGGGSSTGSMMDIFRSEMLGHVLQVSINTNNCWVLGTRR